MSNVGTSLARRTTAGPPVLPACGPCRTVSDGDRAPYPEQEENMTTDQTASLREHLLYLPRGGGAHLDFEKAIAELPPELRGRRPAGLPHSPWRLLEHLRIAQWDILRFCVDPGHVSPAFPEGYWPAGDAPEPGAWDRSVAAFRA